MNRADKVAAIRDEVGFIADDVAVGVVHVVNGDNLHGRLMRNSMTEAVFRCEMVALPLNCGAPMMRIRRGLGLA
eukprot:scaffold67926_cov24-Prasinocladus_malaysianus.AAC.1